LHGVDVELRAMASRDRAELRYGLHDAGLVVDRLHGQELRPA
jgi:hypothetical protein